MGRCVRGYMGVGVRVGVEVVHDILGNLKPPKERTP